MSPIVREILDVIEILSSLVKHGIDFNLIDDLFMLILLNSSLTHLSIYCLIHVSFFFASSIHLLSLIASAGEKINSFPTPNTLCNISYT